jgi:hypothetical protein
MGIVIRRIDRRKINLHKMIAGHLTNQETLAECITDAE